MKKYKIRKLTPEECFELQGMTQENVKKCRDVGIADSQLYKMQGNGLTTNCIQYIMEHLYKLTHKEYITVDEKMIDDGYGVE